MSTLFGYNCKLDNGNTIFLNDPEKVANLYHYDTLSPVYPGMYGDGDGYVNSWDEVLAKLVESGKVTVTQCNTNGYFDDSPFEWEHPPILLTPDLWYHFESEICGGGDLMPAVVYDNEGDVVLSPTEEDMEEGTTVRVLGVFCSGAGIEGESQDILMPSGFNLSILFSDGTCYTPVGQHHTYSRGWLVQAYMVSYEDFVSANGSGVPMEYREALAEKDPYTLLRMHVVDGVEYPEYPEVTADASN